MTPPYSALLYARLLSADTVSGQVSRWPTAPSLKHRTRTPATCPQVRPYDAEAAAAYYAAHPDPTLAIDNLHDIVYALEPAAGAGSEPSETGSEGGQGQVRTKRCRGKNC